MDASLQWSMHRCIHPFIHWTFLVHGPVIHALGYAFVNVFHPWAFMHWCDSSICLLLCMELLNHVFTSIAWTVHVLTQPFMIPSPRHACIRSSDYSYYNSFTYLLVDLLPTNNVRLDSPSPFKWQMAPGLWTRPLPSMCPRQKMHRSNELLAIVEKTHENIVSYNIPLHSAVTGEMSSATKRIDLI